MIYIESFEFGPGHHHFATTRFQNPAGYALASPIRGYSPVSRSKRKREEAEERFYPRAWANHPSNHYSFGLWRKIIASCFWIFLVVTSHRRNQIIFMMRRAVVILTVLAVTRGFPVGKWFMITPKKLIERHKYIISYFRHRWNSYFPHRDWAAIRAAPECQRGAEGGKTFSNGGEGSFSPLERILSRFSPTLDFRPQTLEKNLFAMILCRSIMEKKVNFDGEK